MEVAVTVYVCGPAVVVSRTPAPPLLVLMPSESPQEASPGPPAPSVHEKLVATYWFTA